MANLSIIGKLIIVEPPVPISEKFTKRNFIVELSESNHGDIFYDFITFTLVNGKIGIVDHCIIGQSYEYRFNLKGREFEKDGKTSYFNSIDCWSIVPLSSNVPSVSPTPAATVAATAAADTLQSDDLPY